MIYVFGYCVIGLAITCLRFVVVALAASRSTELREQMLQYTAGIFFFSIFVWPLDLLITACQMAKLARLVWSIWRTSKRMGLRK